ncbi:hypothetical protein ACH5RR_039234 [Cinchona calisaya]|uniref:Uncharacterized protein n=1 Tax=Cinchona calisaya TaxID=153742 RepID=A0ABD2Y067_9GENT
MQECKGVLTPISSTQSLQTNNGSPPHDTIEYRKYLKHTTHFDLRMTGSNGHSLYKYSDADWMGGVNERTCTTGYILYLGLNPISWSPRNSARLPVLQLNPPTIYCDNIGVTYLSQNLVFHSRMKHIVVDFRCVRRQVQDKKVVVTHIHAADQLVPLLRHFQKWPLLVIYSS